MTPSCERAWVPPAPSTCGRGTSSRGTSPTIFDSSPSCVTPRRGADPAGPGRLAGAVVAAWDVALDRLWGHYALSSGVVTRSLPLGDSDLVLDVGGGTGGVSARLRPSVRAVTVIEPSEPLTRRGRGVHRGVGFVVGDGRSLPVRTGAGGPEWERTTPKLPHHTHHH